MMHYTQAIAEANGRACALDSRPMVASNPYRRASKSFSAFERGYRLAAATTPPKGSDHE